MDVLDVQSTKNKIISFGTMLTNAINIVGFIGPLLAIGITLYHLWQFPVYMFVYICFLIVNTGINHGLKLWIRQRRPLDGKSILGEVYTGVHKYGMPSAHAQSIMYSVTYLYSTTNNIHLLVTGLCIVGVTIYQRWAYNRHTIFQLIVGMLIGSIIAYMANWTAEYWINE